MQTARAYFARPLDDITPRDETRFFTALKTANATFKRTNAGRFAEIDAAIVEECGRASLRVDQLLDVGISSGITTLELTETLRRAGHRAHVTGTDRSLVAMIVKLPMGCRALVEPGGHILQYDLLGMAVRPWRRRLDYFTGMILLQAGIRTLFARAAAQAAQSAVGWHGRGNSVTLVSRRLAQVADIDLIEDDVTKRSARLEGRFDFIRAANILNMDYFTPEALARACTNLRSYMAGPGSMLLIVRTLGEERQDGTLFRMTADCRLEVIRRFGNGSEIERIALAGGGF